MVDDNEAERRLARECFEMSDLENPWLEFDGGPAFLNHLEDIKRKGAPMPAVVLLDINMPQMNGFEVLGALRQDPYFERLPVRVMLTNSNNPDDIQKAKALGASGYYSKPDGVLDYVALFNGLGDTSTAG